MGSRIHGGEMTFNPKMLEAVTLDAVKAKSLAQHMREGTGSHFNPEVTVLQRLAVLGDQIGAVFKATTIDLVPGRDVANIQDALLEVAATALTWVEVMDKSAVCTCPWVRASMLTVPEPCKLHPDEYARRMEQRQ